LPDFAASRTIMVDTQVRPADVTSFPIIQAMLHVPREAFVPPGRVEVAYVGENLLLAPGRVLLDPRSFAKLLEALDLGPADRVLHVGAGFGYGTAVLARIAGRVVAVEEDAGLAEAAAAALAGQGVANATLLARPLADGAPEAAPFDAILIEGAVEAVPDALLAQLAPDGRIGAIFAEGELGTARVGHEAGGRVHWRYAFNAGAPEPRQDRRAAAFVL
jgi:protein-L-isoaspartate(D-aspartate) O-methyltransferase